MAVLMFSKKWNMSQDRDVAAKKVNAILENMNNSTRSRKWEVTVPLCSCEEVLLTNSIHFWALQLKRTSKKLEFKLQRLGMVKGSTPSVHNALRVVRLNLREHPEAAGVDSYNKFNETSLPLLSLEPKDCSSG